MQYNYVYEDLLGVFVTKVCYSQYGKSYYDYQVSYHQPNKIIV